MEDYKPFVRDKKATVRKYPGLLNCELCGKLFSSDENFRVVEEGGPFDNNWFAICLECVRTPIYSVFVNNNCKK